MPLSIGETAARLDGTRSFVIARPAIGARKCFW
jgi:hypothetical protein